MAGSGPVRVMIVDDHTLFRRGLTALLAGDPRIEVVGDAADAGGALKRAKELSPDVVLLDNHLPGVRGVDVLPALRGGACGYLLKTMEGDALIDAVLRAVAGESVVADAMTGKLVSAYRDAASGAAELPASRIALLSPREQEILRGIARGASNKEIGRDLGIAETTVKIHVQHVLRKLDVASRVQAAVIASTAGVG